MCNLYSVTKNADAIRRLFGVDVGHDHTGNLPSLPGIFPDDPAPIVRNGEGEPADFKDLLKKEPDSGTTNIRNLSSAQWRPLPLPKPLAIRSHRSRGRWLQTEHPGSAPSTSILIAETVSGPARRWSH